MVSTWKQFLIDAEKRPELRVILMGLTGGRYQEFLQVLGNRAAVFREDLNGVTAGEFEETLGKILKSAAPAERLEVWQQTIADYFDQVTNRAPGDGRMFEAVRMALEFRAKARSA